MELMSMAKTRVAVALLIRDPLTALSRNRTIPVSAPHLLSLRENSTICYVCYMKDDGFGLLDAPTYCT